MKNRIIFFKREDNTIKSVVLRNVQVDAAGAAANTGMKSKADNRCRGGVRIDKKVILQDGSDNIKF